VLVIGIIILVFIIIILTINFYIIDSTKNQIKTANQITNNDIDCILILGAGIWGNRPSYMLEDRLLEGVNLYNKKIAQKIIVSGDHGRQEYNEVQVMKDFLIKKGIPSKDIFMDHAGFSSYDSIYRAKEIFKVNKLVIITQKYHLYRSLHIAKKLNLRAYGIKADKRKYKKQTYRELREILARNKDFFKCILKPKPQFLGEEILITGDGDITND
jgi:SanA protein